MMSTAPPFVISREQAIRLQGYIQTYRQHALTKLMPSTERNILLRGLQTLQGRLIEGLDQPTSSLQLVLGHEAMIVLQATVNGLLALYEGQPKSTEHTTTLNDLMSLKNSLKG